MTRDEAVAYIRSLEETLAAEFDHTDPRTEEALLALCCTDCGECRLRVQQVESEEQ